MKKARKHPPRPGIHAKHGGGTGTIPTFRVAYPVKPPHVKKDRLPIPRESIAELYTQRRGETDDLKADWIRWEQRKAKQRQRVKAAA